MLICATQFKRKNTDVIWEEGVGFSPSSNEMDLQIIVDSEGKVVTQLWSFRPHLIKLCVTLDLRG